MTPDTALPADHAARRAIVERLDENMVVEAGAGTGKTRSLVERVVALVATGRTTMDHIAAITFTEAAAAELRERVRQSLELTAVDVTREQVERDRCVQSIHDLDRAAVQTLHSFAGSLLRERPLEAGLPPGFQTIDDIQADLAFEDRWSEWLDTALDDPEAQESLRPTLMLGIELRHLREIAGAFHRNYDLLTTFSFDAPTMPEPTAARMLVEGQGKLAQLLTLARSPDDLLSHVQAVLGLARRLETAGADAFEVYRLLVQSPQVKSTKGRQSNWQTDPDSGQNACTVIKDVLRELDAVIKDELDQVRASTLAPLLGLLQRFVLDYADERKADGVAEFHDLLVWARDLLRDDIEARDHFCTRYSHILIDELQDTDPLQAEIALFLSEYVPPKADPSSRPRDWADVRPAAGKLFVVGDPKQSIYRFRRADVTLVRQVQEIVGGDSVRLTQNFRSRRPVIEWANHVFAQWMRSDGDQPEYIALNAEVEEAVPVDAAPAVQYIGDAMGGPIGRIRREEARDIANVIASTRQNSWQIRPTDGEPGTRSTEYRDICILMPTRTGLSALEFALEAAGIPYRLESPSMVYDTQELRDLLNCLRAIDDPTDQVSVVAALRSPAFACSDVDLLTFVEAGGQFDYLSERSDLQDYVSEAFSVLQKFHSRRQWVSQTVLIEEFVRDRRLMELALDNRRPRERWRRYRFLMDRARAFTQAGGTSLRAFLDWTERQQSEGARMVETPVPESDEDAVRIMTVHGAKGLEFPIVVLTGLNSDRSARLGPMLFDRNTGSIEVRIGSGGSYFQTNEYERLAEIEKQREDEEFVRLMYVAATRARDHLIISLYRSAKSAKSAGAQIGGYLEGADHLWQPFAPSLASTTPSDPPRKIEAVGDDSAQAREQWLKERTRVFTRQSRPTSVASTRLAKEAKEEQNRSEEPWKRGRAGTNIGRAVHAVLQAVDLASGNGLEDIARAQAAAEGVPGRATEITRLVRHALSSTIVKRTLESRRWWREVPVAGPVGDGIVEGFIDLLFEEDDGFVIVDYKTDALGSDDEIERAMQRYRLQGGGYALALNKAMNAHVKEIVFLFLEPQREVAVEDVPAAMAEAEVAALGVLADE